MGTTAAPKPRSREKQCPALTMGALKQSGPLVQRGGEREGDQRCWLLLSLRETFTTSANLLNNPMLEEETDSQRGYTTFPVTQLGRGRTDI